MRGGRAMASKFSKFLSGLVNPASGGGAEPSGPAAEYKGFAIRPDSQREGSQWRMGGVITKEVDVVVKELLFIRDDTLGS